MTSEVTTLRSKLGIASLLFFIATIFLKISGLLRDMLIAYYFGDSYVADAYFAAFVIPNMIILFFTTGMKNAFVPSYIQAQQDKRGTEHFNQIFRSSILISTLLSLVGVVFAKYYIPVLFPDFHEKGQEIAIFVSIILFISVFFVGMNSVLEAFFDSEHKFSLSMISQMIVVISTIISALLFAKEIGAYSLALGYLIGTILSLIFKLSLILPRRLLRFKIPINWKEIRSFYVVFIPVALTVAIGQINLTVDNIFASYFETGVVTYVNYAKDIVHFPQAIIGVVIGTIIFPTLSKAIAKKEMSRFKRGIERGLTLMYFILFPAIVGMMLLMPNLIELLYERGQFSHEATLATSTVAYYYFGSVLFFSLHNVITKGFYTLQKGHLILFIGGLSIFVNILLNYLFTKLIGYQGIPLASSVTAFLYVGGTFIVFLKLIKGLNLKYIGLEFFKITMAVFIMSFVLYVSKPFFTPFPNIIQMIVVSIVGALLYFLSAYLIKANSFKFLFQQIFSRTTLNRRREM